MSAPATVREGASVRLLDLSLLSPSPTNPRKVFAEEPLQELASSIAASGVLQPLIVRPKAKRFEIVAGERRWRAAKLAGVAAVPAIVREDLDDDLVVELQLLENLQREDLSPLEEARGYAELVKRGKKAEEIAEHLGRSRAHVYSLLKLASAPKEILSLVESGKLPVQTAILPARIPDPKLAVQAAKEIATRGPWQDGGHGPMGYREALRYVQDTYMRRLAGAPFDVKDAALLPAAGSCAACPKRTGNMQGQIPGLKNTDVCTDPGCFRQKVELATKAKSAALQAEGVKVELLSAESSTRVLDYSGKPLESSKWTSLDQSPDPWSRKGGRRTWGAILGEKAAALPRAFAATREGGVVELVSKAAALEAAGPKVVAVERAYKPSASELRRRAEERLKAAEEEARIAAVVEAASRRTWPRALYAAFLDAVCREVWTENRKATFARRGVKDPGAHAHTENATKVLGLEKAKPEELLAAALEFCLRRRWGTRNLVKAAGDALRLDLAKVAREARKAASSKASKRAKKGGKR